MTLNVEVPRGLKIPVSAVRFRFWALFFRGFVGGSAVRLGRLTRPVRGLGCQPGARQILGALFSVFLEGRARAWRRTIADMRLRLAFAVALVASCAGCFGQLEEPAPVEEPVGYRLSALVELGVGPYRAALSCRPGDVVEGGHCYYLNGGPSPGSERRGAEGGEWFCAGVAPEASPYGYRWSDVAVEVSIDCSSK